MKVKEVKHIYKSLKLIIHKKKYLIPQYPQKPIPLYTQFLILKKEDLKYSFK